MSLMFLNGEGMRGGTAHLHIAGSPFIGPVRTAPNYRFFAFAQDFPGLLPVDSEGASISGELYDVPMDRLRNLLLDEPPQLELSIVTLADGRLCFGMIVRANQEFVGTVSDITDIGDWRKYKTTQS